MSAYCYVHFQVSSEKMLLKVTQFEVKHMNHDHKSITEHFPNLQLSRMMLVCAVTTCSKETLWLLCSWLFTFLECDPNWTEQHYVVMINPASRTNVSQFISAQPQISYNWVYLYVATLWLFRLINLCSLPQHSAYGMFRLRHQNCWVRFKNTSSLFVLTHLFWSLRSRMEMVGVPYNIYWFDLNCSYNVTSITSILWCESQVISI